MTEPQYKEALHRLEMLMLEDPEPATDAGRELLALADEVMDYEREHFPETFQQTCDFCGKLCAPDAIDPEEGNQWACVECQQKWAAEDGGVRKH